MGEKQYYAVLVDIHRESVQRFGKLFIELLSRRLEEHDRDKLGSSQLEYRNDWYNTSLENRVTCKNLHYRESRHHPEGFDGGISGMSLLDLVEMVLDWISWAEKMGLWLGDSNFKKYGIDDQLASIIANTAADLRLFPFTEREEYKEDVYARRVK